MNMEQGGSSALRQIILGGWWVVLLRGILITLLGVLLIARPAATVQLIAQFLGAFLLIDGVLVAIMAVRSRHESTRWRNTLVRGVLVFLVGLLVLVLPAAFVQAAGYFLIYLVAAGLLVSGILGIVRAVQMRPLIPDEWSMVAGGTLQIVLGIILALAPAFFGIAFLIILGIIAVAGGVAVIAMGVRMRQLGSGAG
jgi:uncharacterized membrane protein HdeD (DUF308 family)